MKKKKSRLGASTQAPVVRTETATMEERVPAAEVLVDPSTVKSAEIPAAEVLVAPAVGNVFVEGTDEEDSDAPSFPAAEALVTPAVKAVEVSVSLIDAEKPVRPLAYLGTKSIPGMKVRGASLPLVLRVDGVDVGVVVVADPGMIGESLGRRLATENGYGGPVQLVRVESMSRETKLAAARVVVSQSDPVLDRNGTLMALGFSAAQAKGLA
jgi:hypothetical protein